MPARALIGAALLAAACGNDHGVVDAEDPVAGKRLDILFVVEDQMGETGPLNTQYARALPALFDAIGSDTSLHIGVVTADLGTGGAPPIGNCSGSGDDGALQISGAPVTGTFLVDEPGSANFTGDITDTVARMIAGTGVAGCGVTQHLAAIDRAFTNPLDAGFRRPDAALAIIVIADDDDCSTSDFAALETGSASFDIACVVDGITCDQDLTTPGSKTNCQPRTDSPLDSIASHVASIRAAQPDPDHLVVGGIIGPPDDVFTLGSGSAISWNSCRGGSAGAALYDVRLAAWIDALGGSADSSCLPDDTTPTQQLATRIAAMLAR